MTSTYILFTAILLLGGLIAALGDRLGTKVGKARLRLFKLRPRKTAMVITVLVGVLISGSTLAMLLLLSESLRDGLFELDDIKRELRRNRRDVNKANEEKLQVMEQLEEVKKEQSLAREQLELTKQDLAISNGKLQVSSQEVRDLERELKILLSQRNKELRQVKALQEESESLQKKLKAKEVEINKQDGEILDKEKSIDFLKKEQVLLQNLLQNKDTKIADFDRRIAEKNLDLQNRQKELEKLESQLKFLEKEVAVLEEYYQNYQELRERRIALFKGQVLASATIRVVDPQAANLAVDRVLYQANRNAIKAVHLDNKNFLDRRLVSITNAQVKQLVDQIKDGKDYVIRILSASNYVQGERQVRVFADIIPNKKVFKKGQEIATVSIDSAGNNSEAIQERLDILLAATKFRAQRSGIVGDIQIGDGKITTLVNFIESVTNSDLSVTEMKAIVAENTFTSGPLKLNLVAIQDGSVVLKTNNK